MFPVQNVVTSSSGVYTLGNLPSATYKVLFDPTCQGTVSNSQYAIQYDSAEPDYGVATPIDIATPGTSDTGVNATLALGASISGTVIAPGAANAANVCVTAYAGTDGYYENITGAGDVHEQLCPRIVHG